ncbi:hypothetical protein A9264_06275 [Vibrio sp. UCD-FRSSP16_10]|nr:hypothetical protein A9264_06275 [Vibrio sp. UCD-FRSSP16_10]OBT18004.1 hypothetical protein A9260_00270 [Vibrio sp. UCD-FRSSP16_30]
MKRVVLICIGIISLLLGVLGAILPLLPTTPFILLASACFMRASPRLNQKLLSHSTFGPIIEHWQQSRSMQRVVKRKASMMTVLSFAISIYFVPLIWVKLALVVLMSGLLTYLWRLPEPTV